MHEGLWFMVEEAAKELEQRYGDVARFGSHLFLVAEALQAIEKMDDDRIAPEKVGAAIRKVFGHGD